jgi:hypothetical protein
MDPESGSAVTLNTGPGYGSELTENAESGSALKPNADPQHLPEVGTRKKDEVLNK